MNPVYILTHLLSTGGLVLTVFLLLSKPKQENQKANNWLFLFLFWLSIIFLEESLQIIGLINENDVVEDILSIPLFLIAPTFYLSVYSFTLPKQKLKLKALLHLLPIILYSLILIGVSAILPNNLIIISPQFWGDYISVTVTFLLFAQLISYVILCLKTIRTHQKNIQLFASNTEDIDLTWLQRLIYGLIFMVLLWVMQVLLPTLTNFNSVLYLFAIYYLAYYALNQKEIYPFTEKETLEVIQLIEIKQAEPEPTTLILSLAQETEKERLNELMIKEKPYLDNELSLPKLAESFQTGTHQLSYLLNKGLNDNFYDYVNRFRVEESKRLLLDKKFNHLSMVGIALEAGFNSKTAFNTAFKKFTGHTPSEFRKANSLSQ
ncbi:helix-turn-helix domain-containing protein [Algoriphagus sp.]|uniref:helix-turn-helix domain-containing protein n=1 Tax=Algoriphagus sp. TaxID=1872435 RepID=UPI00391ACA09